MASHGLPTENIFNLVNRYTDEEDEISACFGFILKANPVVMRGLVRKLGIYAKKSDVSGIEVETQVRYPGHTGIIDLRIRLRNRFMIFLESKLGDRKLGKDQLVRYAKLLEGEKEAGVELVRLVFVTQFDRQREFEREKKKIRRVTNLGRDDLRYTRWEEIRRLVAASKNRASKRYLNQLFLHYIGDLMGDKKLICEQRIKDVRQVAIHSTTPEWWEFVNRKRLACAGRTAPDAQFVAFYRTDRHAITSIAEVEFTEVVEWRKTYKGFPRILQKAKRERWTDELHKVYHLREIVDLPRPIEKSPGARGVIRRASYKPLTKLLKARTLSELKG